MTKLDERMRALALTQINAKGKTMTFKKVTDGTYDAATGTATPTSAPVACKGIIARPSSAALQREIARLGDQRVYVAAAALTSTPEPGDLLTIDGADWRIVAVFPYYSGELVALYDFNVRR
jgi:hypothetical protein